MFGDEVRTSHFAHKHTFLIFKAQHWGSGEEKINLTYSLDISLGDVYGGAIRSYIHLQVQRGVLRMLFFLIHIYFASLLPVSGTNF